jgi:GLPGLI family protein
MKKHFFLITLMAATLQGNAQKSDTAAYMVRYKFSHLRDTNNRANPYTENMALFLGKNSSVYKSYDKQLEDALIKKQMQEQLANSPDGRVQIHTKRAASSEQYFQFPNERKLVRQESLFINNYLVDDTLPAIAWKISGDTASFGGLHCQKATAHFKGRDYIAWFCPDMPYHTGPWKLNGLPGVTLDARDTKNEVIFKFDGIEKVAAPQAGAAAAKAPQQGGAMPDGGRKIFLVGADDTDPAIIQLPAQAIKTTEKEFSKLQAAMQKDPQAFAQAMMASQRSGMPADGPTPGNIKIVLKPRPLPVIANPIELPEAK